MSIEALSIFMCGTIVGILGTIIILMTVDNEQN